MVLAVTTLVAVLAAVLGLGAGYAVQRAARRYVPAAAADTAAAGSAEDDRSAVATAPPRAVGIRVPSPAPVLATAALCGLAGLRFGLSWQLPAFLLLAAAGVLLAVVDLEHRLLPNRIVGPAAAAGALLLALAAAAGGDGHALVRAVLGAAVMFVGYLVLALIAPSGLGMGDVKLAGLLGLYLGWVGWGAVVFGAAAGFVVQALAALLLLATRRIGLREELPFGPAMLAGAAVVIAWPHAWDVVSLAAAGRM
jgi:leader peptidase (prepilin peptidase) / N-methyltransferase